MSEKDKQNSLKQYYVTDWGIPLFNLIKKVGKVPLLKTYSFSDIISSKQFKKSSPLIGVGFIFILILLILWKIPQFQVPNNSSISEKERITLEDKARGTLIQVIGGLFFFVTAYLTWKNSEISHKQLIVTQEKLESDKETADRNLKLADSKQITERFSKAVEQLGNEGSITVRLGGIYSLERIARNSQEDHWTIMEILTAFVRENSNINREPDSKILQDIQAALTVIGRRNTENDPKNVRINLSRANLNGAKFSEAKLDKANFSSANLTKVRFYEVSLTQAIFHDSNLTEARFDESNLTEAGFSRANLTKAIFSEANLTKAYFFNVNFTGANFFGVNLIEAKLNHADIENADFTGLDDPPNQITVEQILETTNWDKAHFSSELWEQLEQYSF